MRRKFFSVNRIPKFGINLNKLIALISLAFGTACIQIMLSPIVARAEKSRAEVAEENSAFLTLFSIIAVLLLVIFSIWSHLAKEDRERNDPVNRAINSVNSNPNLSQEEKTALHLKILQNAEEHAGRMAEIYRQRDQNKENQELLVKIEKERIERDNKIRDFRNRHGREPNSWEI
jgi:flagellar biosynthesis/type III secretory pathway M-ring protein FliF/YscJ